MIISDSDPFHFLRGFRRIKCFRVKRATPFHEFLMRFVTRIGDRLQVLRVTPWSPDVFGRTRSFSVRTERVIDFAGGITFEDQPMLPAVSKIILIFPRGTSPGGNKQFAKHDVRLVVRLRPETEILRFNSVTFAIDFELVHVVVSPTESRLKTVMKLGQRTIPHLDPSPDCRPDVRE